MDIQKIAEYSKRYIQLKEERDRLRRVVNGSLKDESYRATINVFVTAFDNNDYYNGKPDPRTQEFNMSIDLYNAEVQNVLKSMLEIKDEENEKIMQVLKENGITITE